MGKDFLFKFVYLMFMKSERNSPELERVDGRTSRFFKDSDISWKILLKWSRNSTWKSVLFMILEWNSPKLARVDGGMSRLSKGNEFSWKILEEWARNPPLRICALMLIEIVDTLKLGALGVVVT